MDGVKNALNHLEGICIGRACHNASTVVDQCPVCRARWELCLLLSNDDISDASDRFLQCGKYAPGAIPEEHIAAAKEYAKQKGWNI